MKLKIGERKLLDEDSEWYYVALDVADLFSNYSKVDDPKEYAARSISFVLNHIERERADHATP